MKPAQIAAAAYEAEKQRLVEKYRRKREVLESRGVFDRNVNTIRAENMLLAALGKMKMKTIALRAAKQAAGKDADAAHAMGGPSLAADRAAVSATIDYSRKPNSLASRLEVDLNNAYTTGVQEMTVRETDRRKKNRSALIKRGFVATKRWPGKEAIAADPKDTAGANPFEDDRPSANNNSNNDGAESQPPADANGARYFNSGTGTETPDQQAEGTRHPAGPPAFSRKRPAQDLSPVAAPAAPKHRGGSVRAVRSPLSPLSPLSPGQARGEAGGGVAFSTADWLQKQWEHVVRTGRPPDGDQASVHANKQKNGVALCASAVGAVEDEEHHSHSTWVRHAAMLSVERMLVSPSLIDVVDPDFMKSAQKKDAGGCPANADVKLLEAQ
eukprot:gene3947-6113_t